MGFYIRKGFNFGPLRLNLSRSGLGMSVGVKGARVGVGPKGSYVHLGRGGLYYRQSLGGRAYSSTNGFPIESARPLQSEPVLNEFQSGEAVSLVDASFSSTLAELNRVQRRTQVFPIALAGGITLLAFAASVASTWMIISLVLIFVVGAVFARHEDVTHGTALLNYFLDVEAQDDFAALTKAFEPLASCDVVWHLDASAHTEDWKHQAGASTLLKRSRVRACLSKPRRVVSNLSVPMLDGGRQKLYFFPDRLLIYESGGVGALPYRDLEVTAEQQRFIEDGRPPRDADVVDHTWQYVNKQGGPDRRFAHNPQRDIALYSTLFLTSRSGLRQAFQFSKSTAVSSFASSLSDLSKTIPFQ